MLTRQQTEETVADYVAAAMRAAVDDWSADQHAAWAHDMIAKGYHEAVWRRTRSLWLA